MSRAAGTMAVESTGSLAASASHAARRAAESAAARAPNFAGVGGAVRLPSAW